MYEPIKLNKKTDLMIESYSIRDVYTEAVFKDGKKKLDKVLELITAVRNDLLDEIKEDGNGKRLKGFTAKDINFDPVAFWKNKKFKELELELKKVFGFGHCELCPYIEKYNTSSKVFSSMEMNCFVYYRLRFPIDGIVTDEGFYDSTHTITMTMYMSLGLMRALKPDEILGVLLHEFGHNIDPAIVDINYSAVNILSKYITNRDSKIDPSEKRMLTKLKKVGNLDKTPITSIILQTTNALSKIPKFKFSLSNGDDKIKFNPFLKHKKKKTIERLRKKIRSDGEFSVNRYSEAFADNFARMYGYGTPLMNGLIKLDDNINKSIGRIGKESARQRVILMITEYTMNDIHKTTIHRSRSLINEYKKDIDDPNTPKEVKEQLRSDLKELETIMDRYLNKYSDLQNTINTIINDELESVEKK